MEPSEEPSQISKDNFLEVPNLSDSLSEDEEVKATFRPGFSPQPSRRGSDSSEDIYLENPPSGARRVSFADTFGFNLVSVKEFDCWELPSGSTDFDLRKDIFHTEEYVLSPLFDLPSSKEDLMQQLQVQKAILESTEYLPGSTSMKGIIRVLNISFEKLVYVRMSLDDWQTYYDILAEYVPNSCDGETDQFSFKILLVPPYQKDGTKVEFCIRYETSVGTFWSNNNGTNYVLVCQKKEQELEPVKPPEEVPNRQIKGCLKINQRLIRSTASGDEKNTVNFPNKAEGLEKKQIHDEVYTDLFKRPLSSSSSAERSLKGDFHRNECSHQPSEEITPILTDMGEIKPSFGNTSSDELVQLHIGGKEVLDDNANPAQGKGRAQISCLSADQLMADNLNKKLEREAKKIETKDWECLRRDFHSDFHSEESTEKGSSKKDYGNGKNKEEQRTHLGLNEKQSKHFQPILHDQERKMSHSESLEGVGASTRNLTALPSKDTTIHDQAIRADTVLPPRTNINWEEAVLTTPDCDLSASGSTTLGWMSGRACSPRTRSGNVSRNEYLFQIEEEKSDWIDSEDQNKNTQHKQSWNAPESQRKGRESKTHITEETKEQADCEDTWEKRDSTGSLKAAPTEELFTFQEAASCELSSLADHGITEKAEAGTAYIIKTTSESTLESMSAREKAVIAKLPQETARSDRPIEVKETAFDPHEGRNNDSHDTLCQRDSAAVIHDNDFEKESRLGICNVHADETEKEETTSYNPGKTRDRKKCGVANPSVEESSQVITDNQKAASKLDLHLGMLPTDKKIFLENRDHGQVQELSKKTNKDAVLPSALNSDTDRASQDDSHISSHHAQTSVPSHEQATAVENAVAAAMPLQSVSPKSEYNCNPTSAIQGMEKHPHPASPSEEDSKSSGIETSGSRRERCTGQIFQQGECGAETSLGPTILISEAFENVEEARHEDEGLINSGQSLCSPGDKASESSASDSLPAQESQAQSSESLLSKYINSKVPYFLLFLIFLVTIYQYDLMIGLAFYLFSLYWLSWDGGRQKESVKKK
ncbi:protein phosphatase 1, regulatory (inhibitor) subunit 3C-like protein [Camelus ferus]|nr:protein phosphatase 1, regulatory (inhibitor) subunit 3C-like protein [Camelus ferus]